jgi:Tfp pilus assembly protein PilZ
MVQVLAMSIALVSLGATALSQFAEAMSLFLAVQAMTVLAGTFVPFDVSGGLGMATTSLLAIGMDVVFLTLVGAVLQLSGTPAILFNLAWGIGMHMIAVALFRKQLASTV